jgi:hypothetical protein
MLTIRAISNGRGYAAHHLVHSDYYAEEQRVVGYWQGRGAAELGLVGEFTEEQLRRFGRASIPRPASSCGPGRARIVCRWTARSRAGDAI